MKYTICVLLVAILAVQLTAATTPARLVFEGDDINSNSWDYLLMIARWPQTVCDTTSKTCHIFSNVTGFTLHGIWANRNDTTGPAFCDKSDPFDPQKIGDLFDDLKEYWTDFLTPEGQYLYSHEWEKHGTCSKTDHLIGDQRSFFVNALDLIKKNDVAGILEDSGVYPDSKTFYPDDLIKPIRSALGVTPLLMCTKYEKQNYLLHIRLCVSKDLTLFECNDDEKQHVESQGPCDDGFHWNKIEH